MNGINIKYILGPLKKLSSLEVAEQNIRFMLPEKKEMRVIDLLDELQHQLGVNFTVKHANNYLQNTYNVISTRGELFHKLAKIGILLRYHDTGCHYHFVISDEIRLLFVEKACLEKSIEEVLVEIGIQYST